MSQLKQIEKVLLIIGSKQTSKFQKLCSKLEHSKKNAEIEGDDNVKQL